MNEILGRCIFCGKSGSLSKQHVFPNRIRRILPRLEQNYTQSQIKIFQNGDRIGITPSIDVKQGNVGNRRHRCVCKKCNNGWIRKAEEESFPVLERLIIGVNSAELSASDCRKVSLVASIIASMVDIDHKRSSAASDVDRFHIADHLEAPPNWLMFLARCSTDRWRMRFRHYGLGLFDADKIPEDPKPNVHISTIAIGNIALHVVGGAIDMIELNVEAYSKALGIVPIWPIVVNVDMGKLPILGTDEMEGLADFLHLHLIGTSNVRAWPLSYFG